MDDISEEFNDFLARTNFTVTTYHRWLVRQDVNISLRWLQRVKAGDPSPSREFEPNKVAELREWMRRAMRDHIVSIDPRLGELYELDDEELQAVVEEARKHRPPA